MPQGDNPLAGFFPGLGQVPGILNGGYGQSLSNLGHVNFPTAQVGVQMSLPIRNRTAEAQSAIAQAEGRRLRVAENQVAFVTGAGNNKLVAIDLKTMQFGPAFSVGRDPDVLAFDNGAKRLYVAAESGHIFVFHEANRGLELDGDFHLPHGHTVSVDPKTHLVYFPLEDVNGKPVLRIMEFVGKPH